MELEDLVSQIGKLAVDGMFIMDEPPTNAGLPKILWRNHAACQQSGYVQSER